MHSGFENIINNHRNGNLSDFRKQITKLSKADLLLLVEYWSTTFNVESFEVVNILYKALSFGK